MARQAQLDGEIAGIDEALVFYRPAKAKQRTIAPEKQPIQTSAELEDFGKLLNYIRHRKLRYPIPISDSTMDERPSDLAYQILLDDMDEGHVKNLLSLFCSNLRGKQKMENKYAMLVYFGDGFLLAHVRAERGMSIKEEEGEIELIRRFLDIDNILSAALFEVSGDDVVFSHFTDTGSDAFREFLGVRPSRYHYEKKNIQIICYYQGNKDLITKFEFTNDEFEKVWIQDGSVELSGDKFVPLEDDRAHIIREIRWGNENYDNVQRFKSDFKTHSYNLDGERNLYERLHQIPSDNSDISVYAANQVHDRKHRIELVTNGDSEIVDKGTVSDEINVVYAGPNIDIESSFADSIIQDIVSDVSTSIYHPSSEAASNEFEVNNVSFLNFEESELTDELKSFIASTHDHAVNWTGETLSKSLAIIILHLLEREVEDEFEHAIKQIINVNSGNPKNRDVVSSKENEGDGLIEYKNRQHLEQDDVETAIVEQIRTEIRNGNDMKIFLWGITEQNRRIEGFATQSWNDDRVTGIQNRVRDELADQGISFNEFWMQPIPLGPEGDRWAIAGVFF